MRLTLSKRSALIGWVTVTVVILVADLAGEQTMSDLFGQLSRHRVAGPVLAGVWLTLTLHLFDVLPAKADPFERFIDAVRKRKHIRVTLDVFE